MKDYLPKFVPLWTKIVNKGKGIHDHKVGGKKLDWFDITSCVIGEARLFPKIVSCRECHILACNSTALYSNESFFEYKRKIFAHIILEHPECAKGICSKKK